MATESEARAVCERARVSYEDLKAQGMTDDAIVAAYGMSYDPQQQQQLGGMNGGYGGSSGGGGFSPTGVGKMLGQGSSSGGAYSAASSGNWMGAGSSLLGGIGTAMFIEKYREPANEKIREDNGKEASTWNNMAARAGQGASIGGSIVPGWGHAIGAVVGADSGWYEGKTGNEIGSSNYWKDFALANASMTPMGLLGMGDELPSWVKLIHPFWYVADKFRSKKDD